MSWMGGGLNHEQLRQLADTYGVAVRAGAITPQQADEDYFRDAAGLPVKSAEVVRAWDDDGGVRRPITLKAGDVFEAEGQQAIDEDEDGQGKELVPDNE